MKATSLLPLIPLAFFPQASALSPGEVMLTGYFSAGDGVSTEDAFSFVTWVELAPDESLLFLDGEYDGGGDGSGEGAAGGRFADLRTINWTNTTGSPVTPGTVIFIQAINNSTTTSSLGTTTGGFGLTSAGEQLFIAQGSIVDSDGEDYLEGDLLFGLDYEGNTSSPAWGEANESELPGALNIPNGNISFGDISSNQYTGPRSTLSLTDYPIEILKRSNWTIPGGGVLLTTPFAENQEPPVDSPADLGAVQGGLLFHSRRLNNGQPIIDEAWMLSQGSTAIEADNINGASCIRLPDWLPASERADPSAVYYLYFADHNGNYIRMAWAANLEGPWTGYRMDASTFSLSDRGVLSLGSDDENELGNGIVVDGHIASPQVLVDDLNQDFLMFYHSPTFQDGEDRGQRTIAATSSNGLNFNQPDSGGQTGHGSYPVILGESYLRVFEQEGRLYALANTGDLYAAPAGQNPFVPAPGFAYRDDYWDRGPNLFTDLREERGFFVHEVGVEDPRVLRPRHFAVHKRDNILYAFLTYKEDRPERIVVATFDFNELPDNYENWSFQFLEQELLQAASGWEGGQFPPSASSAGSEDDGVNELRDPGAFQDSDGRLYLFYSGQGEDAIGVAQLVARPEIAGPTEVTTGQSETFSILTESDVSPAILRVSQSTAVEIIFDAEGELAPLIYDGSSSYPVLQSDTVANGVQAYHLGHFANEDDETLTFPTRYYATAGASVSFESRLASSTFGQIAELQISFDDTVWQSLWRQLGSTNENSFNSISIALDGLAGRTFSMRLRYFHQSLRNPGFVSGAGSSTGWFVDDFVANGLEEVTYRGEQTSTTDSISLAELSPLIAPHLSLSNERENRFLIEVGGVHSLEDTGFGKPFVIEVRSSYQDFLTTFFTVLEQEEGAIAGIDADPDGDGLSNLLEHVFGSDPRSPSPAPFGIENDDGSGLLLKFPWNPEAGYHYTLQKSADLEDFTDIDSVEEVSLTSPESGLLELTVSPDLGIDSALEKAFFRLRVFP